MRSKLWFLILLSSAALALTACSPGNNHAALPTVIRPASVQAAPPDQGQVFKAIALAQPQAEPLPSRLQTNCPFPAGWMPYQMQINETVYSVAARSSISAETLLKANCLNSLDGLGAGSWFYLPSQAASSPQTLLPLGISAFLADPSAVSAGDAIQVVWQTTGPVVRVRLGWVYQGRFVEETANLPQNGVWQLQVPADGRDMITYMVRASDGVNEVAAQTTVRIRCPQAWFYSPAPSGCPFPPLLTNFQEQVFERGVIVYIPALCVHYLLVTGRAAQQIADGFVPGMPLKDPALDAAIPAGLRQPTGAIFYAWESDKVLQAALGYAVGEVRSYGGMHQRLITADGETLSFSAGSGQIYQIFPGGAWQVISPQ